MTNDYPAVTEERPLVKKLPVADSYRSISVPVGQNPGDERLTVRTQSGPNPRVTEPHADVARHTLSPMFVTAGDATEVLLPPHSVPHDDAWIIVETDGTEGVTLAGELEVTTAV